ncbi:MAG: phage holin family protein [Patescibacteria group bacterium]
MENLVALFGTSYMQYILYLLLADVVLGIIGAIITKEFRFEKLAGFMKGPVLSYVFGFAVIEMVGQALPMLALLIPAVFVLVMISLLASILRNLHKMGLPLPGAFKG